MHMQRAGLGFTFPTTAAPAANTWLEWARANQGKVALAGVLLLVVGLVKGRG